MPSNRKFFNWPPFKLYAIDADTGKPIDPNVGVRKKVTYYDIKRTKDGKPSLVAHKASSKNAAGGDGEVKKNGNGSNGKASSPPAGSLDMLELTTAMQKDEPKKDEGTKGNDQGGNNKQDVAEWTAAEDAKLKELKATNTPWKTIAEELGRPAWQLKARFKEIKDVDSPAAGEGDNKKNSKDNNKKDAKDEQKNKKSKKAEDRDARVQGGPDTRRPASKVKGNSDAARSTKDWVTVHEDDMFTFSELQLLSELIAKDGKQTWQRVASAFFDKTGRRVHHNDIRDKFAQMGSMG